MSERANHKFQFPARKIAAAAREEAAYHEERIAHWKAREDAALARVQETVGVHIEQHEVTGGSRYSAAVEYGDQVAWTELQLATDKGQHHRQLMERFRTDATLYGSQPASRGYDLDSDDVYHFRLGGQPRED